MVVIDWKKLTQKLLSKYGRMNQFHMVYEEMGELAQAISKMERGLGRLDKVVEEMADVYIVMEQLKIIYNIDDFAIKRQMECKVNRLYDYMEYI